MRATSTPVDREMIREYAWRIARAFRPERILLFGSYAYGDPTVDSDVDLLVIMNTSLRPVDQAVSIREAAPPPFPLDLLVRTPSQVAERLALGDRFIHEIVDRGIVLYDAAHAGVG